MYFNSTILSVIVCGATAFFTLTSSDLYSQCPTDPSFETQGELLDFMLDYPDCTSLPYLSVSSPSVNDLSPLSKITHVYGNLTIYNTSVKDLSGLQDLTSVTGDIFIGTNPLLIDIDFLNENAQVFGQIEVSGNAALAHIPGFSGVNIMYDNIRIDAQYLLTISGLRNLAIAEDIYIDAECYELDLSSLSSASDITVLGTNLTDLSGFSNLSNLGLLRLTSNQHLSSLDGLENVQTLSGDLIISFCHDLENVNALRGLSSIGGGLYLETNSDLYSLSGLINLTSINGDLTIKNLARFSSLYGLQNVTNVGGNVSVTDCSRLISCCSVKEIVDGDNTDGFTMGGSAVFANNGCDCVDLPTVLSSGCNDVAMLYELFYTTNGAYWDNNAGWNAGVSLIGCEPCNWHGITCNLSGSVTKIELPNNNLTGRLPASLARLSSLTTLDLSGNEIGYCIPLSYRSFCGIDIDLTNNPQLPLEGDLSFFCFNDYGSCENGWSCRGNGITIDDTPLPLGLLQASTFIHSGGTVSSPGFVTFQALTEISLLPGFEVASNASFEAVIGGCEY